MVDSFIQGFTSNIKYNLFLLTYVIFNTIYRYGKDGEMAQKVIDGDNVTCQHLHLILKWLKIRTIHFSLISSSKSWSRVFWPKWLTFFSSKMLKWLKIRIIFASNSISLRILSHFNIFELKKVSHFGQKTRDQYFEAKIREKWIVRILSHFKIECIWLHVRHVSFDDFLSHLTLPPVHLVKNIWSGMFQNQK